MSDSEGQVKCERRGSIFMIELDRPRKLNGLTPKMASELALAYGELDRDDELFVGVLHAAGPHFTAGLDLPMWTELMARGESPMRGEGKLDPFALGRSCRKPIVTAVQGITFTAGIEMMLGTDIVVAADDCRFSQMEPMRGIHATGGATFRFVERGGWGNAMLHLLTSDEFDAEEALRIGLVQQVVPAGEQLGRALELAERIAQQAPLAVQATKASSLRYEREGVEACIAALTPVQSELLASEDAAEGVASFREKRPPVFRGR